jgi:hypothetical protein
MASSRHRTAADDRPHRFFLGSRIANLPTGLPGAAIANGNRPVVEQVAAYHAVLPVAGLPPSSFCPSDRSDPSGLMWR